MAKQRYTYEVQPNETGKGYVGSCAAFPFLQWLADTEDAALAGIRRMVRECAAQFQPADNHPGGHNQYE